MNKTTLQDMLAQVFAQMPLKPASMMVVSIDGVKLAEIGVLAEYVQSLPQHDEKSRAPQAMTAAMSSLAERISKELFGAVQDHAVVESDIGVVYLQEVDKKVVIFVDWRNGIRLKSVVKEIDAIHLSFEPLISLVKDTV